MINMNVVCLFSGGKDSTYALNWALKNHKVLYLVSMFSKREDSYMYHVPTISWTHLIAEAIEIKHSVYRLDDDMEKLKLILEKYDAEVVVVGAIASEYQRSRIDNICKELGFELYAPLWSMNQRALLEELLLLNFKIMIVGVAVEGMDESEYCFVFFL